VLARWRSIPFVLEVRDLWPYFAVASGVLRSKLLIRMSKWLERQLYRAADVVVVNSPGFIDHVQARGAKRVELVPNGVDCEAFFDSMDSGDLREQLGVGDGFLVLYAGAHGLSNDLITVLRAATILETNPEIHIALLGAGKEKANLMAQAQAWKLTRVHFLDPVPKEQIPRVLAQADAGLAILMAIDAYKTTYPNKVFDYMAASLPVLCVIDGVIRDVIEQGQAGIFVEPGNAEALAGAILQLAANRDGTKQMGIAGRRWVCAHYDRKILVSEMDAILRSVPV
jgi:glycosyltransferase involved in cell wall biosynthesis